MNVDLHHLKQLEEDLKAAKTIISNLKSWRAKFVFPKLVISDIVIPVDQKTKGIIISLYVRRQLEIEGEIKRELAQQLKNDFIED